MSGIAVSFDGVASHYLSLPPQLPRRPIKWQRLHDDSGVRGRSAPGSLWSSTLGVDHRKDSSGGRAAFPAKAIDAVAQFVSSVHSSTWRVVETETLQWRFALFGAILAYYFFSTRFDSC